MNKKIFILSIFLALHGILSCFWFVLVDVEERGSLYSYLIFDFLKAYNFQVLHVFFKFSYGGTVAQYGLSLLQLFLCLTFLVGAFAFYLTKGKETRLLRFNFGLVVVSQFMGLLHFLLSLFHPTPFKSEGYLTYGLGLLGSFLYLYISAKILHYLFRLKLLARQEVAHTSLSYLLDTSNWKRLLHWIVDNCIIASVIYGLVSISENNILVMKVLKPVENALGPYFAFWMLLAGIRLLYYFVFEYFFSATPAKFLTETRVTDEDGNKPGPKAILIRTVCRFIPLEPFSFLFKGKWHDSLSDTCVINEERSGVKGSIYFWWILTALIIVLVIFFLG